jgi:peptide/nickel transport system permease protein
VRNPRFVNVRAYARAFFSAPSGIIAAGILVLLIVLAIAGPMIWGDAAQRGEVLRAGEGPSGEFLLGTDRLGRDILARTLVATRLSLSLAFAAAGVSAVIGLPLGTVIALLRPRLRMIGQRIIDILLAFPVILIAIFVTAILQPSASGAVIAIGVSMAPEFARIANTLASSVAGREYVAAARVIGVSNRSLLLRYVWPNIAEPVIIQVFVGVSSSLVSVSALSFLGLGVQPPEFDWGRMLAEGVEAIYLTPYALLAPGLMMAITGLCLGFLGEAFARAMNPRLWAPTTRSIASRPVSARPEPVAETGRDSGRVGS